MSPRTLDILALSLLLLCGPTPPERACGVVLAKACRVRPGAWYCPPCVWECEVTVRTPSGAVRRLRVPRETHGACGWGDEVCGEVLP